MNTDKITIYTDGSASLKAANGGWAFVATYAGESLIGYGSAQDTTVSRMELTAALKAFQRIQPTGAPLEVFMDSQYVINCIRLWIPDWLQGGWKTRTGEDVKNVDILEPLWAAVERHRAEAAVRLSWVRGHNGNIYNETADELAGNARVSGAEDTYERYLIETYYHRINTGEERIVVTYDTLTHRASRCTGSPDLQKLILGKTSEKVQKLAARKKWRVAFKE